MELNFAPKSMEMSMLKVPQKSPPFFISSQWFVSRIRCRQPFGSRKFRGHSLKLARCSRVNGFSHGDWPFDDVTLHVQNIGMNSSMQVLPSKVEFPDPSALGIWPEPPDWPERDEVCRISIENKANNFGIPLSLRIITRKQRWKQGFVNTGEFAYCSVKKAFSSLVLIIRELQNYTLVIREGMNCEELMEVMANMQRDMSLTFVWLFQKVFFKTPTLMVYVMLLLANFSVHSMTNNAFVDVTQQTRFVSFMEENIEEELGSGFSASLKHPDAVLKADGEAGLWMLMVDEASRIQGEFYHKVLDHQTRKMLVSPVNVKIEPDNYEVHFRTNLAYQMLVAEDPNNPLLLSNYAQFLHLVSKDHDRAEMMFKRAIEVEPQDAEALGLYADFLWKVRNDHWEAEERYLQAIAAEPESSFYASKYAHFLWNTGGEGTCFPLSSYDKVS